MYTHNLNKTISEFFDDGTLFEGEYVTVTDPKLEGFKNICFYLDEQE